LQVKLGNRHAPEAVLSKATDLQQAILTEGKVPSPVIVAVTLFKEIRPLTPVQAWKVLRLALSIVTLYALEEFRGFFKEFCRLTCFMFFNLNKLIFRKSHLCYSPLPARAPPAFEVLIYTLTFRGAQPQDTNHLSLSIPIEMVEESHEGIPTYHRPRRETV
jgi:hypothetical protein